MLTRHLENVLNVILIVQPVILIQHNVLHALHLINYKSTNVLQIVQLDSLIMDSINAFLVPTRVLLVKILTLIVHLVKELCFCINPSASSLVLLNIIKMKAAQMFA